MPWYIHTTKPGAYSISDHTLTVASSRSLIILIMKLAGLIGKYSAVLAGAENVKGSDRLRAWTITAGSITDAPSLSRFCMWVWCAGQWYFSLFCVLRGGSMGRVTTWFFLKFLQHRMLTPPPDRLALPSTEKPGCTPVFCFACSELEAETCCRKSGFLNRSTSSLLTCFQTCTAWARRRLQG